MQDACRILPQQCSILPLPGASPRDAAKTLSRVLAGMPRYFQPEQVLGLQPCQAATCLCSCERRHREHVQAERQRLCNEAACAAAAVAIRHRDEFVFQEAKLLTVQQVLW